MEDHFNVILNIECRNSENNNKKNMIQNKLKSKKTKQKQTASISKSNATKKISLLCVRHDNPFLKKNKKHISS